MNAAAEWVNDQASSHIAITGGKAGALSQLLKANAIMVPEFEATISGVQQLLLEEGHSQDSYILTNVGTGTSIHHINGGQHVRVAGTGVGGGTIMGLAKLLTGLDEYEDISNLATGNKRDRIDLKVHHIYEGTEPPIPGDLTASNFGNLRDLSSGNLSNEELTSTIVGMVAETITVVSLQAAQQFNAKTIVYIGSTFSNNQLMKDIVIRYTNMYGLNSILLKHGEFSGAVGAMQ
ncbi:type II pantothenate kinase [Chungangia koreensis]|uniref:Type II pantothenate kinase n=1 Tax=Chungangia koreensis TaxID=752657 RepID=A0ABV8WZ05_9LACT